MARPNRLNAPLHEPRPPPILLDLVLDLVLEFRWLTEDEDENDDEDETQPAAMNAHPANPWELLFPPPKTAGRTSLLKLRLLRKNGEPLLLLPTQSPAADIALALYPAQSWKAKIARRGLALLQKAGALPGTAPVELQLSLDSPFAQFLCPPGRRVEELTFAMLLGNPRTAGRRFVLLVFDRAGQPVRVVKAGVGSERALELIRNEINFLKTVPAPVLHAPALQGTFAANGIAALALEYIAGPTPALADTSSVPEILGSWLSRERPVRFADLPVARRLAADARKDEATQRALEKLNQVTVHSAIHHGDFAPWNIRIEPVTRRWVVLDWERGEPAGPPAWDWFHFVLQPEVLVRRASPETILTRFEKFRRRPAFTRYVAQAGIQSSVDLLLLGYAIHCRDLTRQTEGMPTIEGLVERLL